MLQRSPWFACANDHAVRSMRQSSVAGLDLPLPAVRPRRYLSPNVGDCFGNVSALYNKSSITHATRCGRGLRSRSHDDACLTEPMYGGQPIALHFNVRRRRPYALQVRKNAYCHYTSPPQVQTEKSGVSAQFRRDPGERLSAHRLGFPTGAGHTDHHCPRPSSAVHKRQ